MKPEDAEEYTQALGQVTAGAWRQVALAKRLGVPKALGLTTEQWVNDRLGGYIKIAIAERREIVPVLKSEGHSNRAVGQILGVDESVIRDDLAAGNPAPNAEKANKNGDDNGASAGNPAAQIAVVAGDICRLCSVLGEMMDFAAKHGPVAACHTLVDGRYAEAVAAVGVGLRELDRICKENAGAAELIDLSRKCAETAALANGYSLVNLCTFNDDIQGKEPETTYKACLAAAAATPKGQEPDFAACFGRT